MNNTDTPEWHAAIHYIVIDCTQASRAKTCQISCCNKEKFLGHSQNIWTDMTNFTLMDM